MAENGASSGSLMLNLEKGPMRPEAKAAMIDRLAKARAAKKTKADPQPIQEGESAPAQES